MAFNNSDFAITLPQTLGNPGDVFKDVMNRKERQQERNDALAERQREFDQRNQLAKQEKDRTNRLYNLKQIQDATAQKQYETPNHIIDNTLGQELQNIRGEAMKYIGESPEFVTQLITDKVAKVSQWADLAKQHAQQLKEGITEFNKTVPNTDLNSIYGLTNQKFKDNFFNKDDKGNYTGLKDPHLIPQSANYLDSFNDPSVLAGVVNSTAPLYKRIEDIKTQQVGDKEYVNKKGQVKSVSWSGLQTPFSQMDEDENGNPIMKTHYDEFPAIKDSKGNPIKLATDKTMEYVLADPSAKAAAYAEFEAEKKKQGLNVTNPTINENLFRNFIFRKVDEIIPHGIKTATVEKTPAPRITVNVGGAANGGANLSGTLDEHLQHALTNNKMPVQVPVVDEQGNLTGTRKTMEVGRLSQSNLTKPFTLTVQVPHTTGEGENKRTEYKTDEVPFDEVYVTPQKKIKAIYYTRKPNGEVTHEIAKAIDIPLREYTERLVTPVTTAKNRAAVVEKNLQEVKRPQTTFSRDIENGIAAVMQKNKGVSREQVIEALKKAGKIK